VGLLRADDGRASLTATQPAVSVRSMLDVSGRVSGARHWQRAFRERQRERIAASRRRPPLLLAEQLARDDTPPSREVLGDLLSPLDAYPVGTGTVPADGRVPDSTTTEADPATRTGRGAYGPLGRPLNRQSPFYVGFVGALGVLTAYGLWQAVASLDTVLTLLAVAFFLTLALNPIVEILVRGGMHRGGAVAAVFGMAVGVFVLLGFVVVPPVTQQAAELAQNAPIYANDVLSNPRLQDLDQHYHLVDKLQEELNKRLTDSDFMSQVAGGVLNAGRVLASGIFSTLTVLVLTLYFLASLPTLKQAAYAVVPASRRPRVISLSEEIMRRVGSYAIGQVVVAAVNAFCAWIMMSIVGIPYAAVLAVAVGFLGLVPMVGATLGAVLVAAVALFDDPKKAVIALVYFVIYQQTENYLVAPRIMQRTVAVPGAVTIVAALIGGTLLGMLGALLAIPAAAGLLLIYDEVLVPRQRRV
jgi:predicted PurR-regulated permease PerM